MSEPYDPIRHSGPEVFRKNLDQYARLVDGEHGPEQASRRIAVTASHDCAAMREAIRLRDRLEASKRLDNEGAEATLWGAAITRLDKNSDGIWIAHNDEYAIPIRYCPFCGQRL